jgi:hypothetical protein
MAQYSVSGMWLTYPMLSVDVSLEWIYIMCIAVDVGCDNSNNLMRVRAHGIHLCTLWFLSLCCFRHSTRLIAVPLIFWASNLTIQIWLCVFIVTHTREGRFTAGSELEARIKKPLSTMNQAPDGIELTDRTMHVLSCFDGTLNLLCIKWVSNAFELWQSSERFGWYLEPFGSASKTTCKSLKHLIKSLTL